MKNILFLIIALLTIGTVLVITKPAVAAITADTCKNIKDKTIIDQFGYPISLGYNKWGYNYEAHMFNGRVCDAYENADWCQKFKDISLMMKWNDAYLSNKDCGTQGDDRLEYSSLTTPDDKLDRHYPTNTYIGSGAWLTNHVTGTYMGRKWVLNGNYVLTFVYGDSYVHDMTVTDANGVLTGTGAYPSEGPHSITWTLTGSIIDNTVVLKIVYDNSDYTVHAVGSIEEDGSISGTWTSNTDQSGDWSATSGKAVHPTCPVNGLVKIVAVPSDAYLGSLDPSCPTGEPNLLDGAKWFTEDNKEIGCSVWDSFAIIQNGSTDPCGEYDGARYMSPIKKGLGKW